MQYLVCLFLSVSFAVVFFVVVGIVLHCFKFMKSRHLFKCRIIHVLLDNGDIGNMFVCSFMYYNSVSFSNTPWKLCFE